MFRDPLSVDSVYFLELSPFIVKKKMFYLYLQDKRGGINYFVGSSFFVFIHLQDESDGVKSSFVFAHLQVEGVGLTFSIVLTYLQDESGGVNSSFVYAWSHV